MQNDFMKAMDFRHACKLFDETKKIPAETLEFILEAGRKSPSSFGMEPWKFLVVRNEELKAKLRPYCWDQPQITTCSELVIVLAKIDAVRPDGDYVPSMFKRREMPEELFEKYLSIYGSHLAHTMSSDENILAWTARQCYIALGNMMTAAAYAGVDSCPIEGFEKENVEKTLGLDTSEYQLAVILPLGYRVNPQSEQCRLAFDEVVEFIE
ncbi:MAG: NAD(P)H-dependent oxidoreductase [Sulfurimonadaceae bacterium]|nr:NAD(P)H-dependent oxidoreductase [Sulfurimonadaceae bacterium]